MSGAAVNSSSNQASLSTREKLLRAAEPLFAEKGFYGTSIRDVAQAVGISKPSLIHHFPNKERLYSEVLARIAAALMAHLDDADDGDELQQLHRFVDCFCAWTTRHTVEARILMREVLDNPPRLGDVHTWHLKPLLDRLMGLVLSGQDAGRFRKVPPLSVIMNLLGAQNYLVIVRPTLAGLYGARASAQAQRQQADILKRMLDAELL